MTATQATANVDTIPQTAIIGNPVNCTIGRKSLKVEIDFSIGNTYSLNLLTVQNTGQFDSVQTLYVDNSEGPDLLSIDMGVTLQNVTFPAGAQGYVPVLCSNQMLINFTPKTGTPTVNIYCLNFFVPPCVWYTVGMPVNDTNLDPLINNNALNVNVQPNTLADNTDRSGTITAGGTGQPLIAANSARKRWMLGNPTSATEILQYSYESITGPWYDLPIGAIWNEADISIAAAEIFVIAATTGHAFTATEW